MVFRSLCTIQTLLQFYFCWWWWWGVGVILEVSSQSTASLPGICMCSCAWMNTHVCFRKLYSSSLSKFICDRAETIICSLKRVWQPFGCHTPCLSCVHCIFGEACPYLYYEFLCRIIEYATEYRKETNLHSAITKLEPMQKCFHLNDSSLRYFSFLLYSKNGLCSN